ncbi:hypothetical protein Dimus_008036 [Dionaea muscipula]
MRRNLSSRFSTPFYFESLITLDDLVRDQQEEEPSDQAGGSDVDDRMGDEKENKEVKEDERESEEEDVDRREGKVVDDEEAKREGKKRRKMKRMKMIRMLRVKEDVILITKDRRMMEDENKRPKADLEKEKAKGKRSRSVRCCLHNDLSDKSLKNERLHTTLNEATQSLIKA